MTDLPDTDLAPGCFASPLIFKEKAKECAECAFCSQCGPRAVARLAVLREHYGVKTKVEKPVTRAPLEEGELPKKVRELIERVQRTGISIGAILRAGKNPFTAKPSFLKLACHLLIAFPNGVSRDNLRYAFQSKLNWTQGTATAHVLQAAQALIALDAAEEVDGRLMIKRN